GRGGRTRRAGPARPGTGTRRARSTPRGRRRGGRRLLGGPAGQEGRDVIRTRCEVLSIRRTGAYHSVTLVAPDIAEQAKPGQFVEVAVPDGQSIILRRPFSVHQASRRGGWAGTLEIVFDVVGSGTRWLAEVTTNETLDLIGPIGRAFQFPRDLRTCL